MGPKTLALSYSRFMRSLRIALVDRRGFTVPLDRSRRSSLAPGGARGGFSEALGVWDGSCRGRGAADHRGEAQQIRGRGDIARPLFLGAYAWRGGARRAVPRIWCRTAALAATLLEAAGRCRRNRRARRGRGPRCRRRAWPPTLKGWPGAPAPRCWSRRMAGNRCCAASPISGWCRTISAGGYRPARFPALPA